MLKEFEIKIGVRQSDSLSPILFIFEKVLREWKNVKISRMISETELRRRKYKTV